MQLAQGRAAVAPRVLGERDQGGDPGRVGLVGGAGLLAQQALLGARADQGPATYTATPIGSHHPLVTAMPAATSRPIIL